MSAMEGRTARPRRFTHLGMMILADYSCGGPQVNPVISTTMLVGNGVSPPGPQKGAVTFSRVFRSDHKGLKKNASTLRETLSRDDHRGDPNTELCFKGETFAPFCCPGRGQR